MNIWIRRLVSLFLTLAATAAAATRASAQEALPSNLGFEFRSGRPLRDTLRITGSSRASADTTWTQPWGEVSYVRDYHNELRVSVAETTAPSRHFDLVFRVFDDGLGFRYELPAQPALGAFEIQDEPTEFTLADDAKSWWIPSNRPRLDRSEMLYSSPPIRVIDSVQTPVTITRRTVTPASTLHIVMAPGGGQAIRLHALR